MQQEVNVEAAGLQDLNKRFKDHCDKMDARLYQLEEAAKLALQRVEEGQKHIKEQGHVREESEQRILAALKKEISLREDGTQRERKAREQQYAELSADLRNLLKAEQQSRTEEHEKMNEDIVLCAEALRGHQKAFAQAQTDMTT